MIAIQNMQFQQAKTFILTKLKSELPAQLTYHCYDHVIDVYHAAENLGKLEKINTNEMPLLLTAALFHDSGFIDGAKDHEQSSCSIAKQYLPGFGYTADDIEKICGMIMSTKLPQLPKSRLEKTIADADLDYLGRDDFFPISNLLYKEFLDAGVIKNPDEWNRLQVTFFENHHYFTESAIKLRQKKKEANLQLIKLNLVNKI